MADQHIKYVEVEGVIYPVGFIRDPETGRKAGTIYDLEEVSSSTDDSGNKVEYLVFYCGNATELID